MSPPHASLGGDQIHPPADQAMQLNASNRRPVCVACVCSHKPMLRGMHGGLAAADVVAR